MANTEFQRLPAEELYQTELDALIAAEQDPVPAGWRMSPRSVLTYITGGTAKGVAITPKYMGNRRLVEIAIATLVTDRALLLIGEPGTAKSWLSEHLCAAVNGDSTKVVQGTAGTTEEQIRYSWNYAMLIAQGPSREAMIKSPIYRAMETGTIARMEEISRCASEVQDALISILSEKRVSVPPRPTRATRASMRCQPRSNAALILSCFPRRPISKRKSKLCARAWSSFPVRLACARRPRAQSLSKMSSRSSASCAAA